MSLLTTFRILIPEFESLTDETVAQWLKLADLEITKSGFRPAIRDQIIVYLTADRMVTSFKQKGTSGEVIGMREGGLSITYAKEERGGYRGIYQRLIRAHTITPLTRACSWQ